MTPGDDLDRRVSETTQERLHERGVVDLRQLEHAGDARATWWAEHPHEKWNVAVLYSAVGWHGGPLNPLIWSVVMLVVAALLALAMALFRRNLAFAIAIGWALLGIADYRRVDAPALALTALALAVGLTLVVAVRAIGFSLGRFHIQAGEPATHGLK